MIPKKVKTLFKQAKENPASDAYRELVDSERDRQYIKKYCVTPQQRRWMAQRGIECEDLIEGRFPVGDSKEVDEILTDWNEKLGVEWFKTDMEQQTQAMLTSAKQKLDPSWSDNSVRVWSRNIVDWSKDIKARLVPGQGLKK